MSHIVVQRKFGSSNSHCTVSRTYYFGFLCPLRDDKILFSFYCAAVNIPFSLVSSVLSHHGFIQSDNVPVLKPSHLTSLIHDIYFAASKCDLFKQSVDFNLDRCTAILANLFWNIYDAYVTQFSRG